MTRILGHTPQQSLLDIWNETPIRSLRRQLLRGIQPQFCTDCPLGYRLPPGTPRPVKSDIADRGPTEIFVEPTILCNLSCANDTCSRESGTRGTRSQSMLSLHQFEAAISPIAPNLQRIEFYNYGEPFLNPETTQMIRLVKETWPHIYTDVSTNGLLLDKREIRNRILESGLDEIIFSIDGADEASYQQYRRGGSFEKVLSNLTAFLQERRTVHSAIPYTIWRYLLFHWNDSDHLLATAQRLAAQAGVDRFCFEITDHPAGAPSEKFRPGSQDYLAIRHLIWGEARYTLRGSIRNIPRFHLAKRNRSLIGTLKIENQGALPWEAATAYGRRHVTIGISLLDRHHKVTQRDYHRIPLPHRIEPQHSCELPFSVPLPAQPGLHLLCWDLVYEGVGWFSELGNRGCAPLLTRILTL